MIPDSKKITQISQDIIEKWHRADYSAPSIDELAGQAENRSEISERVESLSMFNTYLWHEEDKARDTLAKDSTIAQVKRNIDRLNALRINQIEIIDTCILEEMKINPDSPMNTETPGSVIDRISILMLKKYHMDIETKRESATDEFRKKCAQKLLTINAQLNDLSSAFDILLQDIQSGKIHFKLYKQFKMYNDPELNPVLYSGK